MATIDLSKAKTSFRMDDPNLVSFRSVHGAPHPRLELSHARGPQGRSSRARA